jgi:hypothetical protein
MRSPEILIYGLSASAQGKLIPNGVLLPSLRGLANKGVCLGYLLWGRKISGAKFESWLLALHRTLSYLVCTPATRWNGKSDKLLSDRVSMP